MQKANFGGVEKIPAELGQGGCAGAFFARGAVECVADDGTPERGEMDAKLVRAAGVQTGLDQTETAEKQFRFPVRSRGPAFAAARGHSGAAVQIAGYGQLDSPSLCFQFAVEQGDVNLLDLALLKFFHEFSMRGVGARDDEHAGGFFVEAMHDSGAQRPADGGERAEAIEKRGCQRSENISASGMHHHAGGLIDYG